VRKTFTDINGRIGTEVAGVDFSQPIEDSLARELEQVLYHRKVLVFRNQHLDDDLHTRFVSHFGALTPAHPVVGSASGQPHVLPVDSEHGGRANSWHTDVSFVRTPPKIGCLRAVEIPLRGGDTLFANTAAAYADMPEKLRERIRDARAAHSNNYDYSQPSTLDPEEAASLHAAFTATKFVTRHPVTRVVEETSEPCLYLGAFARSIEGLSESSSRALIRDLQDYVSRPENCLRWKWSPGDVVMWDERSTQHYGVDDYDSRPRRLRRITVRGTVPRGATGYVSEAVVGNPEAFS
jgi:alpha-ketoglutarate-dependent sulfate ester dioxygenase